MSGGEEEEKRRRKGEEEKKMGGRAWGPEYCEKRFAAGRRSGFPPQWPHAPSPVCVGAVEGPPQWSGRAPIIEA